MAALALVGLAASMPRQTDRLNNIRFNSLHPLVFRPQLWPLTGEFSPAKVQTGQESVKIGSEPGPQALHSPPNRQAIKSGIDHLTAMCLTPVRAAGKRAIPLRSRDRMTKQEEARERVLDLMEALPVGQTIPSERQLTQELGVSRLTIRAALDDLVRDGYLDRRHGSGTHVTEPKIAQPLTLTSFSDDMRRRGLVPGSRTLAPVVTTTMARLARRLQVSPEALLFRLQPMPLADDQPLAKEGLHNSEE